MSIRLTCSHCGSSHSVHQRLAGKEIRCPHCDGLINVPENSAQNAVEDDVELVEEAEEVELWDSAAGGSSVSSNEESDSLSARALPSQEERPTRERRSAVPVAVAAAPEEEEVEEGISFPKKELPKDDMDMTPMVDVTFLLLIFFMITASFSSEKVFEEPPPLSDEPSTNVNENPPPVLDTVRVQIDEFNGYTIILPGGDQREASSKQDLLLALADAKTEVATGANEDQLKLVIEAHTESIHGSVVAALDAGREKGFTSFQVQVVEELE